MVVGLDFIRGLCLGVDFPGDGLHCVLFLGIIAIYFMSDEYYKETQ